ncbi:hypothetical protein L2K70_10280 [Nocardioides KLBMP 9356]|uniref:Uncharacterized protein n=1 Tax=Nocardioides potassii TaxID=2911371 RepID=A0ABS9H9V1_9ACTN|nr:hypothetical protein [Nocardioides potassii]MCF6377992.1 hypothetical protein [Nocardioides potassii]
MPVNDAVVGAIAGGGFALAGVALQQALAINSDKKRFRRERMAIREDQCTKAFADLVVGGRRVQRALVDRDRKAVGAQDRLAAEVDKLAESAALVRVLVTDRALLQCVEEFEDVAKQLQTRPSDGEQILQLTPLIALIQTYEAKRLATL